MRYSTALYLCFATTSTIGYGEYTPDAPLSRATICVYAFLTLAIFSLLIGEVVVPRLFECLCYGRASRRRARVVRRRRETRAFRRRASRAFVAKRICVRSCVRVWCVCVLYVSSVGRASGRVRSEGKAALRTIANATVAMPPTSSQPAGLPPD